MKDRPDKGQAKELTINVYKGRMHGYNVQLTNYQREVMDKIELEKMKNDDKHIFIDAARYITKASEEFKKIDGK